MSKHGKEHPLRHCFNCGAELGRYLDHDHFDTCGKRECVAVANDVRGAEELERRECEDSQRYERGYN